MRPGARLAVYIGAEPITRSQTRAPSPVCLRTQFSRDYYCLLCCTRNEIRVRYYYYYMLSVLTHGGRGTTGCWSFVPGRAGWVVLLMRFHPSRTVTGLRCAAVCSIKTLSPRGESRQYVKSHRWIFMRRKYI